MTFARLRAQAAPSSSTAPTRSPRLSASVANPTSLTRTCRSAIEQHAWVRRFVGTGARSHVAQSASAPRASQTTPSRVVQSESGESPGRVGTGAIKATGTYEFPAGSTKRRYGSEWPSAMNPSTSASRTRRSSGSLSPSLNRTGRPPAASGEPAWDLRSPGSSSSSWAARSECKAPPARAPPSGSPSQYMTSTIIPSRSS